ncbi:MAG: hypothetical protein E7311_00310 [Clostridiales bacterium]|nr:hypothetical protein [Clostridiales bacterium]
MDNMIIMIVLIIVMLFGVLGFTMFLAIFKNVNKSSMIEDDGESSAIDNQNENNENPIKYE